jgi:predicted AAA+ superfamily ATPase
MCYLLLGVLESTSDNAYVVSRSTRRGLFRQIEVSNQAPQYQVHGGENVQEG